MEEVEDFVLASTQLAMQLLSPFVRESHAVSETTMASTALQTWIDLDRTLHLCLVANGQACRASLYQGQGLLRVAKTLLPHHQLFQDIQQHMATKNFEVGHFATVFGLLSKELGISSPDEACSVLQYCLTRDVVSAAVRLNLVGPLASFENSSTSESRRVRTFDDRCSCRIVTNAGSDTTTP